MSNYRISGLADPTDADDAVTRRYVASRFQAFSEEVQGTNRKLDALQNLFGVTNKIRKYEIIGANFVCINKETPFVFRKDSMQPGQTNTYEFIDMFTLKEYFFHLLEKLVDDVTWLIIKQSGTYTIHFDLICSAIRSFSSELPTRDEIIHFF